MTINIFELNSKKQDVSSTRQHQSLSLRMIIVIYVQFQQNLRYPILMDSTFSQFSEKNKSLGYLVVIEVLKPSQGTWL